MTLLHGTCVAVGPRAVLLRGRPGSGKSDLGLRLIDAGGCLVADDQVRLKATAGRLHASAPAAIRGLIEVRGVGVVTMPVVQDVVLAIVVDLVEPHEVERLPPATTVAIDGVSLPRYRLCPFEASATAKIRLLLRTGQESIVSG